MIRYFLLRDNLNAMRSKNRQAALMNFACRSLFAAILSVVAVSHAYAQSVAQPQRERLLNGLKILLSERPGEQQATLRLRIHSGASFDLAGKEGTIALLSDLLFPDASTREYVKEELDGRLEVSAGYDSIDVTLSGRASEVERLAELLRNALVNTQLSPEVFERVRDARLKTLRELEVSPVTIADRAVHARLFGTYPYGRQIGGTPESIARIEIGDLIFAKERFLNPNNSTLVITGGFDKRRAMRALRQYLGGWRKGDAIAPQTFRQPEAADARALVLNIPEAPDTELRIALRGLRRSDRDAPAALALAELVRERWMKASPELKGRALNVNHVAHALDGAFTLSVSVPSTTSASQTVASARKVFESLTKVAPAQEELEAAKRAAIASISKSGELTDKFTEGWLDEQTYNTRTATQAETVLAISALTPSEVQRVAAKLFNSTQATVAVGDAARLRDDLSSLGGVEIFSESSADSSDKESARPASPQPLKSVGRKRP